MKTLKSQSIFSLSTILLAAHPGFSQAKTSKPNVIFILADDFGYTDVNY